MNHLKKITELKKHQALLIAFLEDPGKDGLITSQKLKLCAEITAMQMKIARLERFPIAEAKKEVYEWPMLIKSRLVKARKPNKKLIKVERTWHFPLKSN